jgi:nicotinamidase-related amidase
MAAELTPYLERFPLVDKSTYSSWTAEVARLAEGYDRILLSGVVAECCVLATLMAAMDAGKKVVYLADCVAGQSDEYERSIQKIAEIYVPMHTLVMDANAYLSSQI